MTTQHKRRRGNVLVLTCFLMVGLLTAVAFAVDLGYLMVTRTQLQRTADASAIAAAWDLVDDYTLVDPDNYVSGTSSAFQTAAEYAAGNPVLLNSPTLSPTDVEVGQLLDPWDSSASISTVYTGPPNAVHVTVRRDDAQNGRAPLFFARVMGIQDAALQAEATAVLLHNVRGFQAPGNGGNLGILPFALDLETWNGLLAGVGDDNWTWNEEQGHAEYGSDGILEINLYPQSTGAPGNRGTVDIGSSNNSTADIARQILEGVTPEDLEHHGGSLELDEYGELLLNGDTGISAGVKDELASIIGQPRIIPVFSQVVGPGNNADYTIVQFVGVRIVDVKLTGPMSKKHVTIQPANVVMLGGIPNTAVEPTSYYIHSPVWLIR